MPPSIRSLATFCGVSTATVSRALAGHPSVLTATRQRIEAAARQHNYVRNPLVGNMMAQLRAAQVRAFVGNLALVHVPGPQKTVGPQQRRIIRCAQTRARELGYQLYEMSLGEEGMRPRSVVHILKARGVLGVIFLHTQPLEGKLEFPWEEFVCVQIDYGSKQAPLHTVCHDHFSTLTMALERLQARGYRRIGLFLEKFKDARTHYHWSAAFRSFQESRGGIGAVPLLHVDAVNQKTFLAWFRRHRPDLVIGHFDACIDWLATLPLEVPRDVGFFSLNWQSRQHACAGVDPRLESQGEVAVETLIAQLQRGERGLAAIPRRVLVPGGYVDGPTIRALPAE